MDKDYFLMQDRIKQIETSFIEDGWITIYESTEDDVVYCYLVDNSKIDVCKSKTSWDIMPSNEGKPSIITSTYKGESKTTYQSYADEGFEPFIFKKDFYFHTGNEQYVDISEEFVLYFNLYEQVESKQKRTYFFIDELGDLNEVIRIEPKKIKIKLKYLKEYIAVRQLHFVLCFDFMRIGEIDLEANEIELLDKHLKENDFIYRRLISPLDDQAQSWILGKKIISFDPSKSQSYHFDYENQVYEKFITGYDENGDFVYQDCSKTNEKYFVLTYFKKEVLNKYYNEPKKYEVDGWHVKSKFFTLKIDNNNEDYVAVFLIELGYLPHKEQLHWKHHNIEPQKGISHAYYQTMIEGNWVDHPETPDLFFKHKYEQFNKKWEAKFGWRLYKPLAKEDEFRFNSLHIPTSNNVKSFCEQILSISIITIDRLNSKELAKTIIKEDGDNSITKFEKFLEAHQMKIPDMIVFLRNLWDLRSGLLAHSFSNSNSKCKKAIKYFGIKEDNYIEVAKEIFIKSIYTFNTLEGKLLNEERMTDEKANA